MAAYSVSAVVDLYRSIKAQRMQGLLAAQQREDDGLGVVLQGAEDSGQQR